MKIRKIAVMILCACSLLAACDTDRYANQSTVTFTEVEAPETRKALIHKLNEVNFDYELTKDGNIRYPRANQAEFEKILAQVMQESQGTAAN